MSERVIGAEYTMDLSRGIITGGPPYTRRSLLLLEELFDAGFAKIGDVIRHRVEGGKVIYTNLGPERTESGDTRP